MKTDYPLIVTARIDSNDLAPFDRLRQQHFPPSRNVLHAHLTVFYRLPGEYVDRIQRSIHDCIVEHEPMHLDVSGLRHLGAGVAFTITSPQLQSLHADLRRVFLPWLGSQDMQPFKPHITIQNKAPRQTADRLHAELAASFRPQSIRATGLELWSYLGGPWRLKTLMMFGPRGKG